MLSVSPQARALEGPHTAHGSIGRSPGAGADRYPASVPMVLPDYARITWTVNHRKPATFGGTTISLYGR